MTSISTELAPAAIGPYSQARRSVGLLFVSGQLPIDPSTGTFNSVEPAIQVTQCLQNIAAIASAAGTDIKRTVKTTVFLTDLKKFAAVNEAYSTFFVEPFPARACVEVSALPRGAAVEVEAIIEL